MNINHYAYNGIGEQVVTFKTSKSLKKGDLIKLDTGGSVSLADVDGEFIGVVLSANEDYVSAIIKGFVELPLSTAGSIGGAGYQYIVSKGNGTVAGASTGKQSHLVIYVHSNELKAGIIL